MQPQRVHLYAVIAFATVMAGALYADQTIVALMLGCAAGLLAWCFVDLIDEKGLWSPEARVLCSAAFGLVVAPTIISILCVCYEQSLMDWNASTRQDTVWILEQMLWFNVVTYLCWGVACLKCDWRFSG